MKKIIALAVAGAFAAPVMAADVTVGGELEFVFSDKSATAGNESKLVDNANLIKVSATEEVNGITITGFVSMGLDGEDDSTAAAGNMFVDAQGITVAGEFGAITVGDTAGALDNYGDYTDVSPFSVGYDADGSDMALRYDLPSIVPGLKVSYSMTPKDGAFVSGDDEVTTSSGTGTRTNGVAADASSFAAAYSFSMGEVYVGTQDVADVDTTSYGVKATYNGLTVALESGKKEEAGATDIDYDGLSAVYKMGDISFIYESQEEKQGTTTNQEESAFSVEYNLGSNVDLYVEAHDDKKNNADYTYVGVEYNF